MHHTLFSPRCMLSFDDDAKIYRVRDRQVMSYLQIVCAHMCLQRMSACPNSYLKQLVSFAGGLPTACSWEEGKGEEEKQHEHRGPDEERRRRRWQRGQNERVPEQDDDQRKQQQHRRRRVHLRLMSGYWLASCVTSQQGSYTNLYYCTDCRPVQYHIKRDSGFVSRFVSPDAYCIMRVISQLSSSAS